MKNFLNFIEKFDKINIHDKDNKTEINYINKNYINYNKDENLSYIFLAFLSLNEYFQKKKAISYEIIDIPFEANIFISGIIIKETIPKKKYINFLDFTDCLGLIFK